MSYIIGENKNGSTLESITTRLIVKIDPSHTMSVDAISVVENSISAPIVPNDVPTRCQSFLATPFFKWFKITLIVIYALNVVAWGGMLFLILVGAANKTMPDEETRKIWIEIDSQILNGLFCIPGLGLIPWRLRDFYQLHSSKHRPKLLRRHSYTTKPLWIYIVVWSFIANSIFQIGMAVCMWSMNRYTRPSWLMGLFVGLGCASGLLAGLIQFFLGRKTKKKAKEEKKEQETIKNLVV